MNSISTNGCYNILVFVIYIFTWIFPLKFSLWCKALLSAWFLYCLSISIMFHVVLFLDCSFSAVNSLLFSFVSILSLCVFSTRNQYSWPYMLFNCRLLELFLHTETLAFLWQWKMMDWSRCNGIHSTSHTGS